MTGVGKVAENNSLALVLASSSPRRQELIGLLKLPVMVRASNADESVPEAWAPARIVEELSLRKARATEESLAQEGMGPAPAPESWVIVGSDTIVVVDGKVLGKPADQEEAFGMLASLQGREHEVYTGVACIPGGGLQDAPPAVSHTVSKVMFSPMSEGEIWAYVRTGEPMDKAGAYGVQGMGALFIEKIEGDFFSVMGLPVNRLYQMLASGILARFKQMNGSE
ncbi:nucleoside triphosphate pyrophosphatase [Paenibacillus sp. YN15]|uniref:Maf family protein n=1 Tax=Paenibacillus sp. YN15 TaxID=1742774 RepID=UPI000DCCD5D6|nr:Maf family protein [Paenibacillus sp. YN15]RAV06378.1 septum formation protein Maf [Paenibacillus sp. YN15]